MSTNRCVAEKGEDLPLNISRSSSRSWFYLTKTASLVSVLQVAGGRGQAEGSSMSKWYRGPGPYEG